MDIKVVSRNPAVYQLCREAIAEMPPRSCTLCAGGDAVSTEADLVIWDIEPNSVIPSPAELSRSRHLFLVPIEEIEIFKSKFAGAEANILPKPVDRNTLSTVLGLARSSSLCPDSDDLLHCLLESNLKLHQSHQARSTLPSRAVHDLSAPLTALRGYCGLLLAEPLGALNAEQKEVVLRMLRSANRLNRMTTAMLDLMGGRKAYGPSELIPGDIRTCVDSAIQEITSFADEKRLSLTVDVEPCEKLCFEKTQIEEALINLLSNACKFTPRVGSIEVRGGAYYWDRRGAHVPLQPPIERRRHNNQEPNSYRIHVRDSGTALSEDCLEHLFSDDSHAEKKCRGGGLGLSICRGIVAMHDGRIWAENTDFGPAFSFVLPFRSFKYAEEM